MSRVHGFLPHETNAAIAFDEIISSTPASVLPLDSFPGNYGKFEIRRRLESIYIYWRVDIAARLDCSFEKFESGGSAETGRSTVGRVSARQTSESTRRAVRRSNLGEKLVVGS